MNLAKIEEINAILFGFKQALVKGYVLVVFDSETLEKAGGHLK